MEEFWERLITDAATVDELLSDEFETLPGQKIDSERAARRLAAWCRSSASGDWGLFGRRLKRDGWDYAGVLERLASVRRKPTAPTPGWFVDAGWIDTALHASGGEAHTDDSRPPCAFEELWFPVVAAAQERLWSSAGAAVAAGFTDGAREGLGHALLRRLCELSAPAVYGLFDAARNSPGWSDYGQFIAQMRAGGLRQLFQTKPVLLRLLATVARQWIDSTAELATRLGHDLSAIRDELLAVADRVQVTRVIGDVGDLHNGGRSVLIVVFEGGRRVLYKPKDLGVDVAWRSLVERLNASSPPVELRAVRALAREGYGWTEFVEHTGCADSSQVERYFARAGAWLALFYCFGAGDMHQENIIAAGEHPVPVDIETILQAHLVDTQALDPESHASYDAMQIIADSAMSVGLIPSYATAPNDSVYRVGGLISDCNSKAVLGWQDINTDVMQPVREWQTINETTNLPHTGGRYANLADHIEGFISGFEDYARFLTRWRSDHTTAGLFDAFTGLVVRHVLRPTRFYSMLLRRLHDHRNMDDGAIWSAHADFPARLADWTGDNDQLWPLLKAERSELIELNIPFFTVRSDTTDIRTRFGSPVPTRGTCGIERAMNCLENLDGSGLQLQVMVIRQNLDSLLPESPQPMPVTEFGCGHSICPPEELLLAEAGRIAAELSGNAIRRGPGAAWIALEWMGDADAFQLTCLGPDLYNGGSGIAVFLAAYEAVTGCNESGGLARAAVIQLRKRIAGSHGGQLARRLGIGGATGVGSVVYALTVMAKCLHDDTLLADAHRAAALITDDLIGSDVRLDIVGGSAGAILALLALHRHSPSTELIACATRCGEHLLGTPRVGLQGRRTWSGQGPSRVLTGMSHGAAGYAYALAELASATGRADFAAATAECLAFENSSYDHQRQSWPRLCVDGAVSWPCQWCHGAPGIGLARIAVARLALAETSTLTTDIERALAGVENGWTNQTRDTLCCGTLGTIEFLAEAGTALGRSELRELAQQRLIDVVSTAAVRGDYRWIAGKRQFNPGLFRGLAGVGYSILRQLDPTLPNVLLWD